MEQLVAFSWVKKCYLAGGTAVALHLGHRFSDDLDFFERHGMNLFAVRKNLSTLGSFSVTDQKEDTLVGAWKDVKFSLFNYPYKLLEKPFLFEKIPVASLTDIALMKLDAISSRGTKRDFIDIFWIASHSGKNLLDYVRLMKKKYGQDYSIEHLIKSLSYFEDAEKDPPPRTIKKIIWEEVKSFFIYQASSLARKFIF